jgi:hypothetical protein
MVLLKYSKNFPLGPTSQIFHHLPIASSAVDQAFASWAFGRSSISKLLQLHKSTAQNFSPLYSIDLKMCLQEIFIGW